MTSFTYQQLRRVAAVYAKLIGVKLRAIRTECRFTVGHKAHMHYTGLLRGTLCLTPKVLEIGRTQQISLLIHELHHLVPTTMRNDIVYPYKRKRFGKLHSHRHKAFTEKAAMWSYGCRFGYELDWQRLERYEREKITRETLGAIAEIEVAEN